MTSKEKLNSILRLRLFYSTEAELSEHIGYNLKGNHFNRFKEIQSDAYFNYFAEECDNITLGNIDLSFILEQYKATSEFFCKYIKNTRHEKEKQFLSYLLDYIFLEEKPSDGLVQSKDVVICERYDTCNKDKNMNIGILLLITYGLLPTFNNKTSQDITDIIGDFQKTYDILMEIADSNKKESTTIYNEILCLKELRQLIEDEKQNNDKYLNRILLIFITNDSLGRIYSLMDPARIKQYNIEVEMMDFELARFWRCEEDADNIIWEFTELNNGYYMFRKEIDYKQKKIFYTRYQLIFRNTGYKYICLTTILRPSFNYHNLLKQEQTDDSQTFDYTSIEYERNSNTVSKMTFELESPSGEKTMTIKPIKNNDTLKFYQNYIDHEELGKDFEDVDKYPEFAIETAPVDVAVTNNSILFNLYDGIYKMDKLDNEGNETIAGIQALTHWDNYVIARLKDKGKDIEFLCLDTINQNLELESLLKQTYFNKIKSINDIFSE